ncbi:SDR family oxidoreductase [Halomonas sp. PAMB 3232]|uniref:SDR family oxidoreductase n=1 Tax=Halomonas sp. PAMB 3232 TaxID=3075221 RepID=UPI00289D7410|nr:SDR family oxidoreductase [Halomonas sp. PAMB 3232]WNL39973.1 SDR family oxidoreductase [Halomonas sp. PAMB 3232]
MTTLVVGANGQIGKQYCQQAHSNGIAVRAMVRREDQATWFTERGIDVVIGDLEGEMAHAFDGCSEVVFAAGSGPHTGPDKTLLIDLHGAMRTVDLAREKGLKRFLMVSAIRAEKPLEASEKMRPYMVAKLAADRYLENSGLPYVILKPGPLTDEAPTHGFTDSKEDSPSGSITRADVAYALVHVSQHPAFENRSVTLLNGERSIDELLG